MGVLEKLDKILEIEIDNEFFNKLKSFYKRKGYLTNKQVDCIIDYYHTLFEYDVTYDYDNTMYGYDI